MQRVGMLGIKLLGWGAPSQDGGLDVGHGVRVGGGTRCKGFMVWFCGLEWLVLAVFTVTESF